MAATKKPTPGNRPKSKPYNVSLKETLNKRALAYSEKTGFGVPALLRNGLDLLLKQNNF